MCTLKRIVMITAMCLMAARSEAAQIGLSAAASLKDVINELSGMYEKQHPGVRIVKNFGASGALAKQVESGAPIDIFISANREWIDVLKLKKLVAPASIEPFAFNTLVFVGRGDKKIAEMKDLVTLERVAIGSPKSVPAGEYAMEALKKAGIDKRMEKKLVMARDVRECLTYAERGEVDGAFVYKTDALLAKQVTLLFTVHQELHTRVSYPMALTAAGALNKHAEAFFRFLGSGEARAVLEKYGFAVR